MYSRGQLAQQNIQEAQERSKRVRQKLHEEADTNRLAVERFFNTLTLVSGGTLALSLTYLGYLKTAGGLPTHLWSLKTCWLLLLVCMTCSIFYNNFHTRYVGHARSREYADSLRTQRQASIREVGNVQVIDEEGTAWSPEELKASLTTEMNSFERDVNWNKVRENFYAGLYTWDARVAQGAFVLGLALLLTFALLNT